MKFDNEISSKFLLSTRVHERIMDLREKGEWTPWKAQMARANIPPEFWDLELDYLARKSTESSQRLAIRLVKKYIRKIDIVRKYGFGFLFLGSCGVGKTSLQMAILKAALKRNYSAYFITLPNIFRQIYMGFKFPNVLSELQDILYKTDFLAIGELGKDYHREGASLFAISEFDTIFRERRQNCLPTSLDSNLTETEVLNIYGDSIVSLFASRLKKLKITGRDYRKDQQQKEFDRFIG